MSLHTVWSERLSFLPPKRLIAENSAGRLSSDAGLLVVREFDQRIGLTWQFAAALRDARRDPDHSLCAMVRQRIYGILAGYEDQNDHDRHGRFPSPRKLRFPPPFKDEVRAEQSARGGCVTIPSSNSSATGFPATGPRPLPSQRSPGSRMRSMSNRCSVCGNCSSISSSTRSTRRPHG